MVAYLLPLSAAWRAVLDSSSALPQEELALDPLNSVLMDIPFTEEPVVLVSDLNTRVASRCYDLPDHSPRSSVDPVVNSRGPLSYGCVRRRVCGYCMEPWRTAA